MRGAYFDPTTNIRYNTNDADFEGEFWEEVMDE